eukprot:14378202-Heterocapsa_arctica.AAC.1
MAEYLGVLIGPGAFAERWMVQAARFCSRVALVASLNTSAYLAALPFHVLAFSVLRYCMMFYK